MTNFSSIFFYHSLWMPFHRHFHCGELLGAFSRPRDRHGLYPLLPVGKGDHCPVARGIAVDSYRGELQKVLRGVEIDEHLSRGIIRAKNLRGNFKKSVSRVEFFDLHAIPIEEVSNGRQAAA
jgi:hypothetical protein